MSLRSLRSASLGLRLPAAAGLVAIALGGCLQTKAQVASLDPATTGSIAGSRELTASADELGRRFDANPGDLATGLTYARVLKAQGLTTQAVAVLQQTTLRNPRSLEALGAYGKALADAGRFRDAAEVLPRAHLPERPDWRILSVQGAVADQLGDFAGAQRYYDIALRIAPNEPSVLSNQGLSFALAHRLDDAERVLRNAVAQPNADPRVARNLAMVLALKRDPTGTEPGRAAPLSAAAPAVRHAGTHQAARGTDLWKAIREQDEAPALPVGPAAAGRQAALAD